jgi:hypothetical protein
MKRGLAVVLLALALALAGCGDSGDDGDGIATAGDDPTEQSDSGDDGTGAPTEDEIYEAQLAYVECMREHGIDMDDPQPGEPLRLRIEGDPEEAQAAQEACQDLLPQQGPGGANPEEAQERMLGFAECMRENGVESFPDPQPGGGIQIGPEQADDPDFQAAQETCQEEMGLGEPGTTRDGGGA